MSLFQERASSANSGALLALPIPADVVFTSLRAPLLPFLAQLVSQRAGQERLYLIDPGLGHGKGGEPLSTPCFAWAQCLQLMKGSEAEPPSPSASSLTTTLFWKRRQRYFFHKPYSSAKYVQQGPSKER